jgi:C-terminal processing protease CtpA/Prc
MKYLLLFGLSVICFAGLGQSKDSLQTQVLSPEEMREDLMTYKQLLLETHPGLFRYQSKEEFDNSISGIETKISEPLPFYTFYRLIARLSADIRCAHTQVFPMGDILSYMRESCEVFPLFLYPIDERLYVLFNGTEDPSILPGDEIISVNGKPITEIREIISRYYFRDGNNDVVLRRFVQGGLFSLYYYLMVEQPSNFEIVVKNRQGEERKYKLPALTYAQVEKNYTSNTVNTKMMSFYNKKHQNWDMIIVDEVPSTAYMNFASFGSRGVDTEDEAQETFKKFMDKSLKKLRKSNIQNLIIELRGNTGGWDIQGKELFSYLMKSDTAVSYYETQTAITNDSDFLKYSDLSEEDLKQAGKYLIPMEDGTFKLDPAGNKTLLPQSPKENRFTGNVYIIMDEQCASTCAEFTAAAKANKIGVFVGNESGGAYEGGNGGSFITYSLPNSGIYSNSPLVKYTMAVPEASAPGRGTIPDHLILLSHEDLLNGYDAPKQFVFELIRKN